MKSEPHLVVTEYDGHHLHWWCSCGYDTNNQRAIKRHLDRKEDDDRAMREQ